MPFSTLVAGLALMSTTGWAQYVLEDDYTATGDFFGQFSFWESADPTNGFVDYVSWQAANDSGLLSSPSASPVTFGVDHTNIASNGRQSVRLTSNKAYNSGLVILDLEHMPGSICGTWPAFWMVGPDWPDHGEIDIIEGVNDQSGNDMTLHTAPGCSINQQSGMLGKVATNNCDVNAAGQGLNEGCKISSDDSATYGNGFNSNNGGVYATEVTSDFIKVFFFSRGSIPSDISSGSPNPSSWGEPMAMFQGGCDMATSFGQLQIVFDITFCGDWAGAVWPGSSCAASTGTSTCNAYVQNNPSAFADSYWAVNSLKVYQGSDSTSQNVASSVPSSTVIAQSVASPTTFAVVTSSSLPIVSVTPNFAPSSPAETSPAAATTPSPPEQTDSGRGWTIGDGGMLEWHGKEKVRRHLRQHKRHAHGHAHEKF